MNNTEELKKLGEFGLIRQIQERAGSAAHLVKGIGDDCAIQRQASDFELLTSTDLLVEGVHFNRQWTSMQQLGQKSAAVNLSDIAAMGGRAKSIFLAVASPAQLGLQELQQFTDGFLEEISRHGATLAGGDTCRSSGPLLISVTVQGDVPAGRAVCRDGAREGDAIYVSGSLGDSGLALQQLQAGQQPDAYLLQRHNRPSPRLELGQRLAEQRLASAMLDVSDGLLSDLGHILNASGVGAEIELAALPLSEPFRQALAQDRALIDLALAGGEDYELLFTSSRQGLAEMTSLVPKVTKIGQVQREPGLCIRQPDGSLYRCAKGGFDHFSG